MVSIPYNSTIFKNCLSKPHPAISAEKQEMDSFRNHLLLGKLFGFAGETQRLENWGARRAAFKPY